MATRWQGSFDGQCWFDFEYVGQAHPYRVIRCTSTGDFATFTVPRSHSYVRRGPLAFCENCGGRFADNYALPCEPESPAVAAERIEDYIRILMERRDVEYRIDQRADRTERRARRFDHLPMTNVRFPLIGGWNRRP